MNKENLIMNIMDYPKKMKMKQCDAPLKPIPKKIFLQSDQPQEICYRVIPVHSVKINNKQKEFTLLNGSNKPFDSSKVKFGSECLKTASTDNFNRLIDNERELESNINFILMKSRSIMDEMQKALLIKSTLLKEQEELRHQLDRMKMITEQKRKASLANISNLNEIKAQMSEALYSSKKTIQEIQTKRQKLLETTVQKNNQIHLTNTEYNILSEKELDIASIEKTLLKNISQTEIEIKKTEKKKIELHLEVNRLQEKKNNHNQARLETLSHILTLKPYYKKFLIYRTCPSINSNIKQSTCNNMSGNMDNNANTHNHYTIIHKNRKTLLLNESTQYKFDYIISSISNPYEENSINETHYINNELVNMLMSYISQFNQGNEHKNCFVLYISHISYRMFNETIMTLINNVLGQCSEYFLTIRLQLKDAMITLNKDIELEKQIDKVKEFPSAFIYELKDENNVSKIWFCNAEFENMEIGSILFKLNEQNQTKIQKKKVKNNNILYKETNANILLKEINEFNSFYSLGVIDISEDEINQPYVHSVMNEI